VDYSARVQTVEPDVNPRFHGLLDEFEKRTGCPVLVNTSFNVRGEPIVCTPEDAYRCFMRTGIDYLVVEDFLLEKSRQPEFKDQEDWRKQLVMD
jgi:carbamoyltransferase